MGRTMQTRSYQCKWSMVERLRHWRNAVSAHSRADVRYQVMDISSTSITREIKFKSEFDTATGIRDSRARDSARH